MSTPVPVEIVNALRADKGSEVEIGDQRFVRGQDGRGPRPRGKQGKGQIGTVKDQDRSLQAVLSPRTVPLS